MGFDALSDSVVSLCQTVMGKDITYTPDGGSGVSIKGIFDHAFVESEGIQSVKPVVRINLSDLDDEPGKGDTVTIDAVTYRVVESQKDSYGGSTLILQKT
jgi:hypothetical protein